MARSSKSGNQRGVTATQLLKKDHDNVKQLFQRFDKASDRADETKQKLVEEIERELEAHTTIEEEIFYPAVQDEAPSAKDVVQEAYEEHNVAKSLLRELGSMASDDDQYDAKVKVLQENVEHHIQEEEGEMFPKAEQLGDERLKELGSEMMARKEALGQPALRRITNAVSGLIFGNGESGHEAGEKGDERTGSARSSGARARSGSRGSRRSEAEGGRAEERARQRQSRSKRAQRGRQSQQARGSQGQSRGRGRSEAGSRSEGASGRSSEGAGQSRSRRGRQGARSQAQKRSTTSAKKRGSGRSAEARGTSQRRSSAKKQRSANGASGGGRGRRRTNARSARRR